MTALPLQDRESAPWSGAHICRLGWTPRGGVRRQWVAFPDGLAGSRACAVAGLSLTPSVETGLRHDGGNAETGAGMDVGAGLVVSESSTGLSLDLRVRTLRVH